MKGNSQFIYACKEGNLKLAQQLLQNNPNIDISYQNEYAFRMACQTGQLHVAQWLLKVKPTINISAWNEDAFK